MCSCTPVCGVRAIDKFYTCRDWLRVACSMCSIVALSACPVPRVCTVCPMKTKVFKLDKYTQTRTHKINQINAIENCIQSAARSERRKNNNNNELNVWHVHSANTVQANRERDSADTLFFPHFSFVRRLRQCSLAHSPALFLLLLFISFVFRSVMSSVLCAYVTYPIKRMESPVVVRYGRCVCLCVQQSRQSNAT